MPTSKGVDCKIPRVECWAVGPWRGLANFCSSIIAQRQEILVEESNVQRVDAPVTVRNACIRLLSCSARTRSQVTSLRRSVETYTDNSMI